MKLVFLDIDGVLNSAATWRAMLDGHGCHPSGDRAMCPELVGRLNRLLRESGANVVVSSAWRGAIGATRAVLKLNGIECRMIGCTPRLSQTIDLDGKLYRTGERGLEIQAWLDRHSRPVSKFIILDDDDDMAHLRSRLVQTDPDVGLQDADVERALQLLA